jgi:hypothetical protein
LDLQSSFSILDYQKSKILSEEMATALKGVSVVTLGSILAVVVLGFLLYQFSMSQPYVIPGPESGSARLPCLANDMCPIGQKCSGGFCSEGFVSVNVGSKDMSSCSAPECNGINAPCKRTATPCPEGTFCQKDACKPNYVANDAPALNQIGDLPL